jgi:hypothetical protein
MDFIEGRSPSPGPVTRLEDIAAKRRPTRPYVDPFPVARRLLLELEAVAAGKACLIPRYGPHLPMPGETAAAFDKQMAEYDSMHRRLTAKPAKEAA